MKVEVSVLLLTRQLLSSSRPKGQLAVILAAETLMQIQDTHIFFMIIIFRARV
jgi:hypothetical protein